MIDFTLTLQTEKVLLRPMAKEDIEAFSLLTADKSMWTFFVNDLSDRRELEKWVADALEQHKTEKRLPFTIIDKSLNRIIGSTSLGNISYIDKRVEIGWTWISKDYQGKGFNDEVKFLMLKYCFEALFFERVEFKTDVLNVHARNALKRIGCTEEGILRSHTLMTNNRRRDTIYYSILREEWTGIKYQAENVSGQ